VVIAFFLELDAFYKSCVSCFVFKNFRSKEDNKNLKHRERLICSNKWNAVVKLKGWSLIKNFPIILIVKSEPSVFSTWIHFWVVYVVRTKKWCTRVPCLDHNGNSLANTHQIKCVQLLISLWSRYFLPYRRSFSTGVDPQDEEKTNIIVKLNLLLYISLTSKPCNVSHKLDTNFTNSINVCDIVTLLSLLMLGSHFCMSEISFW
jgi:hypothetical protein